MTILLDYFLSIVDQFEFRFCLWSVLVCWFRIFGQLLPSFPVPRVCSVSGLILFFIFCCSVCLTGDFFPGSFFDWIRVGTIFLEYSVLSVGSFSLFGSVFLSCVSWVKISGWVDKKRCLFPFLVSFHLFFSPLICFYSFDKVCPVPRFKLDEILVFVCRFCIGCREYRLRIYFYLYLYFVFLGKICFWCLQTGFLFLFSIFRKFLHTGWLLVSITL